MFAVKIVRIFVNRVFLNYAVRTDYQKLVVDQPFYYKFFYKLIAFAVFLVVKR